MENEDVQHTSRNYLNNSDLHFVFFSFKADINLLTCRFSAGNFLLDYFEVPVMCKVFEENFGFFANFPRYIQIVWSLRFKYTSKKNIQVYRKVQNNIFVKLSYIVLYK